MNRSHVRYFLLLLAAVLLSSTPSLAYGPNDPAMSCITPGHGGPNPAGALRAPGASQQTCITSYVRLDIDVPILNQDFDLLYSGYYSGHPYMNANQPLDLLKAMGHPDSARQNEFHKDWTDVKLNFNYFHARSVRKLDPGGRSHAARR